MAKKPRVIHTCTECGYSSPKWLGRCPECGSWGTLQEEAPVAAGPVKTAALTPSAPAHPITKIEAAATATVKSGIGGARPGARFGCRPWLGGADGG